MGNVINGTERSADIIMCACSHISMFAWDIVRNKNRNRNRNRIKIKIRIRSKSKIRIRSKSKIIIQDL